MGGVDFAACGAEFLNGSSTIYAKYVYNGSVEGILGASRPVLMSLEGCKELCGTGIGMLELLQHVRRITEQMLHRILCLVGYPRLQGFRNIIDCYIRSDAANTITTWVLPIIGLMVQAPYESNRAWHTVLAICRWAGSPIASLSYIYWNIKVTGKCALMVDSKSIQHLVQQRTYADPNSVDTIRCISS